MNRPKRKLALEYDQNKRHAIGGKTRSTTMAQHSNPAETTLTSSSNRILTPSAISYTSQEERETQGLYKRNKKLIQSSIDIYLGTKKTLITSLPTLTDQYTMDETCHKMDDPMS